MGYHISAAGIGSFVQGYTNNKGGIYGLGAGSFTQGFSDNYGIISATTGSFAQGYANGSSILAGGYGSFAQGHAEATYIYAGMGSFAQGHVGTYITAIGSIFAYEGGFAQGEATYGYIQAYGKGGFAQGWAGYDHYIQAYGKGSFAQGYAGAADIVAYADYSVQFGPGTNNTPNSLRVMESPKLVSGGKPNPVYNGDIWIADGFLYGRSNGVDCKFVNSYYVIRI